MDASGERERRGRVRVGRWFLLTGNRRVVAAVLLAALFVSFVPLAVLLPVGVEPLLTHGTITNLFTTMLSGIILLVSIVVSVASLVVSQEFTPIGQQRRHIEESIEFRRQTEAVIDLPVSPAEPAAFLRAITRAILQHAQHLDDEAGDALSDFLDDYLRAVADETAAVDRALGDGESNAFAVLLAALEYDHSRQLYELRRMQAAHGEELSDAATETLDDLVDALQFFATSREYFKSLYFEREFATLARDLLAVSLPAILLVSYALLAVDARLFDGFVRDTGVPRLLVATSLGYTVAFSPFVVLTAYVVRVATIAKRTLSAGPFILDGSDGRAPDATPERGETGARTGDAGGVPDGAGPGELGDGEG